VVKAGPGDLMIRGLAHLYYEEKLRELVVVGLLSLEKPLGGPNCGLPVLEVSICTRGGTAGYEVG